MTIHEFSNSRKMKRVAFPDEFPLSKKEYFPPAHSDLLVSEDGEIFIAINRVNQRFAADCAGQTAMGFADVDLTPDQLEALTPPSD